MRSSITRIIAFALFAILFLGHAAHTAAQESWPSTAHAGTSEHVLLHDQPPSAANPAGLDAIAVRFGEPAPVFLSAVGQQELARKDHLQGAFVGAGLGALVGGVGFAAVTYLANDGPGQDYWPLGLVVGAVGGGAVGGVLGAIIGVER